MTHRYKKIHFPNLNEYLRRTGLMAKHRFSNIYFLKEPKRKEPSTDDGEHIVGPLLGLLGGSFQAWP